ncbi:uncharacterized protein BDW43DRAFT_287714 [Aspergillus alliaceus]|nr:uncharacterized protein BDW43DRAFT_287714 [Aspergillus alliaceus]KAB8229818.1 hypothetical protein BDW43DRAFT_287714 [Aspergillus alliaceus]
MIEKLVLEKCVEEASIVLTADKILAFITPICINVTSKRWLKSAYEETSPMGSKGQWVDALAEVFCLSDPSYPDNSIIFASER